MGEFVHTNVKVRNNKEHITTNVYAPARTNEYQHVVIRDQDFTTTAVLTCGSCDRPAAEHPFITPTDYPGFYLECHREVTGFPYVSEDFTDYVVWPNGSITLPEVNYFDQSGSKFVDPDDYQDYDSTWSSVENYYDKNPQERTLTLEEHQGYYSSAKYSPFNPMPESTNAYVEGVDGFTIKQFIDELLTRKHHAHLLNVFVDKRSGLLRCGSVELKVVKGYQLDARCVSCNVQMPTVYFHSTDRHRQEDVVWAIISHGNNHAASFIRNRSTFYELAPMLSEPADELTPDNEVQLLFKHQQYCHTSTCQCASLLSQLAPVLT
jgi:hypothetical protein